MSFLITGASGMLGKALSEFYPDGDLLSGRSQVDLTNFESVNKFFYGKRYDTIIHCAAYTDLNYCELEPLKAFRLHATVVRILQDHCDKLIYISTNPTDSLRYYYLSKQSGEDIALQRPDDLVIRTNIYGLGGLFEWAVFNLKSSNKFFGYDDVVFNPVSVHQLADFIFNNSKDFFGVVNVCSDSIISKHQFILDISKKLNIDPINLQASKKNNDLDLTVPIENSFTYPYLEGLDFLCKKLIS